MLAAGEVRGLARYAARHGVPAGRAYRLACRSYRIPSGSWSDFAAAYDDEKGAEIESSYGDPDADNA